MASRTRELPTGSPFGPVAVWTLGSRATLAHLANFGWRDHGASLPTSAQTGAEMTGWT